MRRIIGVQSAVIGVLLLTLLTVVNQSDRGITLVHADTGSDESPPTQTIDDPTAPAAVTAGPTTLVYFAPSDNDANATVVVLYNTTAVTQTVVVKGYVAGGAAATWNINVGPNGVVHVVSDSVAASPPPSWANSVVTNFTDFTTYATLNVPAGVRVDGYILFNPGTGTVDPCADQGAIPLHFSSDPLTVFLPTVSR
jgi:hypothetical protein